MRVLIWGTYDTGKPRIRILREGLRANGVDVRELHAHVWEGIDDKSQVRGLGAKLRIMLRWLLAYPALVWRFARADKPDLLLISYPGILDAFVISLFAWIRGIPVAWDIFLSIYDTVCEDRRLVEPRSTPAMVLRYVESTALRCANVLFMDTQAHARRVERLFGLEDGCCDAVWVGVETQHFSRYALQKHELRRSGMRVLFYGQFIPLHGVNTIIEAARLLRDHPIQWHLVGRGQEAERIREMLVDDPLPNVHWTDWVDYANLNRQIADADLCLGIFGTSDKAASVIPNKVFQIVAAGRPLITRDSQAIRELLAPSAPCAYLVAPGDSRALADAVLAHFQAAVENSTSGGYHDQLAGRIDAAAVGRQFLEMIQRRKCLP